MVRASAGPRSYCSYIGGQDRPGVGWVYTISARSLLENVFTSVSLKRHLEKAPDSEAAAHPSVVGRCAVAGPDDIDAATEAAAAAVPAWAAMPLAHRMRLGGMFRDLLVRREEEFLGLLTAEGHPKTLAR